MAKIGTLIDGKYEVLREIGRGGMSVVYLAMDTRLNKQWAIKEIARKANDANNDIVVSSLLAEANLMKKLDHPALPRIVDIIEEQNTIYVVMDYIEGEPLSKILDLYGAQDQDTVIEWGKQLCDVLFYLHNCEPPIIYRDMKPANIMLKPDGSVKLIDFGIAREYKRSKTADTESLGTRGYAAPEQFGGKGQTDARTDIYSFGVTLYHLVTGLNPCEPPYELYPIKQINPNYYDGLQYLIQKCIQMNPEDRFQSCDEIRYVLDNIQEFDKGRRISQKKKFTAFIVMVILTIVFAILGTGMFMVARASLNASFGENLDKIKTSNDIVTVDASYDKLMQNDKNTRGLSDTQQLQMFTEYYAAADRISNDPKEAQQVYATVVVPAGNPFDFVEDDILSSEEAADVDASGNIYSALSAEQRAYLAKAFYHQASLAFKQNSSANSQMFVYAEQLLSHVLDTDQLNIENSEYDTEIFTNDMLQNAKAIYYLSVAHSSFSASGSSGNSVSLNNSGDQVDSTKEIVEKLVESIAVLDARENNADKLAFYNAYHSILNSLDRIKSFKSSGVSVDSVNELYKAIYGEDYMTVCNQAIEKYGSIDSVSKTDVDSMVSGSENGGIYSVGQTDSSTVKTIKSNRFTIAGYIYKAFN